MDPQLGRHAFNLAFYFVLMSGILLPFLNRDSPEFIAAVFAFIFSLVFLLVVVWEVRREARIPKTLSSSEERLGDL
ncbi:MAG: hypothetical protein NZ954_02100 [Thermofilaceae archaeon]|nr:hypothetical protein [Thermofilaceae archaeon]MDW8003465.1 hypothetical protein [Thermofilaceae archaeon]